MPTSPQGQFRIRRRFPKKRILPPSRCGHRPLRITGKLAKSRRIAKTIENQANRFCVLQSLAYTPLLAMSSACVPDSTILPSETTRMRLAARMVDRRWAMMSVVRSFASSSNACWILASVRESSALVASSRIRTGGFLRKIRAIEMRCFCPPERSVPRSPT